MFSLSDGTLEAPGWSDERFNPITCKFLAVGPAVPGQRRAHRLVQSQMVLVTDSEA